jgi:hypothetical protein
MRESTFTIDRHEDGGVAVLSPPRIEFAREFGRETSGKRPDDFAAAAHQAIMRALSADSEKFLAATRQTSGE